MAQKRSQVSSYWQLTKPSIVLLVLVTALATLAAHGILFTQPIESLFIVLAIGMAAGAANALNQFLDRDIDAVMERTKARRPIPKGEIPPYAAVVFALILILLSSIYLWTLWSPLSAMVSLATIGFYAFFYTLVLKRHYHYNIVIGGAAGAAGPLIAWAAVEGSISAYAWFLFLIIFMWTPPHFWALALAIKDEYAKVNVPMLPITHGVKRTEMEIFSYTVLLLPISLLPVFTHDVGMTYTFVTSILWLWYFLETRIQLKRKLKSAYFRLFYVSIIYLFLIFVGVTLDGAIRFFSH